MLRLRFSTPTSQPYQLPPDARMALWERGPGKTPRHRRAGDPRVTVLGGGLRGCGRSMHYEFWCGRVDHGVAHHGVTIHNSGRCSSIESPQLHPHGSDGRPGRVRSPDVVYGYDRNVRWHPKVAGVDLGERAESGVEIGDDEGGRQWSALEKLHGGGAALRSGRSRAASSTRPAFRVPCWPSPDGYQRSRRAR